MSDDGVSFEAVQRYLRAFPIWYCGNPKCRHPECRLVAAYKEAKDEQEARKGQSSRPSEGEATEVAQDGDHASEEGSAPWLVLKEVKP